MGKTIRKGDSWNLSMFDKLLKLVEEKVPDCQRSEIRRLCELDTVPDHFIERLRRDLDVYRAILKKAESLSDDGLRYKESVKVAVEAGLAATLDDLEKSKRSTMGRNDWLFLALTHYLQIFGLGGRDLFAATAGLMIYGGGVAPSDLGLKNDFDVFGSTDEELNLLVLRLRQRRRRLLITMREIVAEETRRLGDLIVRPDYLRHLLGGWRPQIPNDHIPQVVFEKIPELAAEVHYESEVKDAAADFAYFLSDPEHSSYKSRRNLLFPRQQKE